MYRNDIKDILVMKKKNLQNMKIFTGTRAVDINKLISKGGLIPTYITFTLVTLSGGGGGGGVRWGIGHAQGLYIYTLSLRISFLRIRTIEFQVHLTFLATSTYILIALYM